MENTTEIIDAEILDTVIKMGTKSLDCNVILLEWYFRSSKLILNDEEKQKVFSFMTYASIEDPYCFMRILLYIANTRHTDDQEISYKIIIHFLGTMFPEFAMANLDLFITHGKKDDVLYFMQCPNIAERVISFIKHKSHTDDDFKILLDGNLINRKINRHVYYKPKFGKNKKWDVFLFKILDDPAFNGITL
jgi:hypothetical protein